MTPGKFLLDKVPALFEAPLRNPHFFVIRLPHVLTFHLTRGKEKVKLRAVSDPDGLHSGENVIRLGGTAGSILRRTSLGILS